MLHASVWKLKFKRRQNVSRYNKCNEKYDVHMYIEKCLEFNTIFLAFMKKKALSYIAKKSRFA